MSWFLFLLGLLTNTGIFRENYNLVKTQGEKIHAEFKMTTKFEIQVSPSFLRLHEFLLEA